MFVTTIDRKEIATQAVKTVIVITGMVVLPFLIHLIPFSGTTPLGAILLPMFIAPLVGAFYSAPVGLVIAVLVAPLLNNVLTGMPALPNLYVMMIELLVFSMVVTWYLHKGRQFFGISALAFLFAKVVVYLPSAIIFGQDLSLMHFGSYLTRLGIALPGILVLILVERMLISKKA